MDLEKDGTFIIFSDESKFFVGFVFEDRVVPEMDYSAMGYGQQSQRNDAAVFL